MGTAGVGNCSNSAGVILTKNVTASWCLVLCSQVAVNCAMQFNVTLPASFAFVTQCTYFYNPVCVYLESSTAAQKEIANYNGLAASLQSKISSLCNSYKVTKVCPTQTTTSTGPSTGPSTGGPSISVEELEEVEEVGIDEIDEMDE